VIKKILGLVIILVVAIVVWLGIGAERKNKEISWQIRSEIGGVELGLEEESLKTYLDRLGLWPIWETEIYNSANGGGWQKVGQDVNKIVFRIKDISRLGADFKEDKEESGRLGKKRGSGGVDLIQFTQPKVVKGEIDFLVYINWQEIGGGSEANRAEALSYIVLEALDFGLRGKDRDESRDRKLMERLGERITPYIEVKSKTGLIKGLAKPVLAQYCSGITLCEVNQEIYQCVGGANNGYSCDGEYDTWNCPGGTCTYIRTDCVKGAYMDPVSCVYKGNSRCGGNCPPGRCDIGACGWAWFPTPGDPTPTPPGPTTAPITCEQYGSLAGAVVYVYEDSNNNGIWDSGERQVPLASGDPLLGNARLVWSGGLCSDYTTCSGNYSQSENTRNSLILAQIPCIYWEPNTCGHRTTARDPALELSQNFSEGWSGWPWNTLINWGYGTQTSCDGDPPCLNNRQFRNNGLGGASQFWYFNIGLKDCVVRTVSFRLEGLPATTLSSTVYVAFTPQNMRDGFGESQFTQVRAVAIPIRPCVDNCSCADTVCQGSSCTNACGVVCPGVIAPSCGYSAWTPETCSPLCGQTQNQPKAGISAEALRKKSINAN